jgi:hypothetical protein
LHVTPSYFVRRHNNDHVAIRRYYHVSSE